MTIKLPRIHEVEEVIRRGSAYSVTATITNDGAAYTKSASSVTCSIYDERDMANALVTKTVAITSASDPLTVRLDLAAGDSELLHAGLDPRFPVSHFADFRVVATDGTVNVSDPWRVWVANGLTGAS